MLLSRDSLPQTIPDIAALDELLCPREKLVSLGIAGWVNRSAIARKLAGADRQSLHLGSYGSLMSQVKHNSHGVSFPPRASA